MNEIRIGIQVSGKDGFRFFGIDEVNEAIRSGHVVTGVAPGGAITEKVGEDDDGVRLRFAGCSMVVTLSETAAPDSVRVTLPIGGAHVEAENPAGSGIARS